MTTNAHVLPSNGKGSRHPIQVFTPTSIQTISAGDSLDTTNVTAIRIAESTTYQINGAGDVVVMPIGVTGIHKDVTSLKFTVGATVEVM